MPLTATSHAESKKSARLRPLPVAQIYEIQRVELLGRDVLVTVLIGDESRPPRIHGLRAPIARLGELLSAVAASTGPAGLASAPVKLSHGARAGLEYEVPPIADPSDANYRRPVLKPNGRVL